MVSGVGFEPTMQGKSVTSSKSPKTPQNGLEHKHMKHETHSVNKIIQMFCFVLFCFGGGVNMRPLPI